MAGKLQSEEPDVGSEAYVLQITMPDFGAITWDNGAFALQNALGWTRMMDRMAKGGPAMLGILFPDPKLDKAFDVLPLSAGDTAATGHAIDWYQDWVKHEDLSHEYWTQQSHTASVSDVTAPVLMVTGWYDIFAPWQLRNYRQLVEAGRPPLLTVGPWGHRSKGKAAPAHQESVAFLKHALGGESWDRAAPVRAFQTGADAWHDLAEWPPVGSQSQSWVLGRDGDVATEHASFGIRTYSYNPDEPTPAVGGPSLKAKTEPLDNRAHENRPDVLVYRSAVLTDPLEIAGEPVAHIRIRSSAPSFDVFVRITDVHPDGRSITVCDGIRRIGSVGTHASDPSADSDDFRDVSVGLWPTFHQIAPGHRLGIQVSSGAHPRYARNPGTGEPAFEAVRTVVANQEIAHGGPVGSRIELPVWSR